MVKTLLPQVKPNEDKQTEASTQVNYTFKSPDNKIFRKSPESSQTEEMMLLIKRKRRNKSTYSIMKAIIIFLIVVILLAISYFTMIKTGFFKMFCMFIYDNLMSLYKNNPILTYLLIWVIEVVSLILILPLYSILTFIVCSIFKNFWVSYLYCLFCSLCGSSIIYFISNTKLKPCLIRRFDKNLLYSVLRNYCKEKPWKTAFLTRFLFIAAGVKEYILGLVDNPFLPFIVTAGCLHTMWILEVCFIHMEIGEISSFMDRGSTPWSKRSFTEKFWTVVGFLIIIFTVLFMIFLGYKAKKILKKEKEKNQAKRQINEEKKTLEKIV